MRLPDDFGNADPELDSYRPILNGFNIDGELSDPSVVAMLFLKASRRLHSTNVAPPRVLHL
ncbi:hypothetical protein NOR51B_412 [Luminiphilus syltensis NOR5-1B]|uniref:Uncharacterized protein n=1 Tax=Luminiphilus syltensis NOR5-1B TaxID=565045 RepID=B8KVK6_9GAMM|nr:hypothetical protein NOR51B_412 [Luminiphilus syltensis NOR5-1B]